MQHLTTLLIRDKVGQNILRNNLFNIAISDIQAYAFRFIALLHSHFATLGLLGRDTENLSQDSFNLLILLALTAACLGQCARSQDDTSRAVEVAQFFKRRVVHSAHIGDNHHAVTLIADMQFAILNLRITQRTEIQKIVIQTSIAQPLRRSKCAIGRSVRICLHRLGGIHQCNVADVVALTEQVAHTLGVLQPPLHMRPIRHTEVETGRRPLPPTAVCRVV